MPRPVPLADAPALAIPRVRPALLAKGFRPFFFCAAAWAVIAMPLWLLVLHGRMPPGTYLPGPLWHAHEMLFGFTAAVIAGFLLTAIGNWTQQETATGLPLASLVGLWGLGRLGLLLADYLPPAVPACLDLAFLPALGVACGRPIVRTANRRNYQFLVLLALLFAANVLVHLGALGAIPTGIRRGHWLATHVVIVMILVISGRIVPLFTRNATRVDTIYNLPLLDRLAIAGVVVVAALDLLVLPEVLVALAAGLTAVAVVARTWGWGLRHTSAHPLLWILHLGHLWIAVGLALRAAAGFGVVAAGGSTALHAFTGGAIAALTLGMMTRVTLGHTGRLLAVPPTMTAAFGLVLLAGIVRLAGPLLSPAFWLPAMVLAGAFFSLAFAAYLGHYAPFLLAPRPDGRPG